MLRVIVLGAAAGGGLPQWNCRCANCVAARRGEIASSTQASLAVSANDCDWFLINASPDVRQQLAATPRLHPPGGTLRQSPIAGVILTNAEVDAIAGLLSLRETSPLLLYADPRGLALLDANAVFSVLSPTHVQRIPIATGISFQPRTSDGRLAAFDVTAFTVPGKEALYLEGASAAPGGDTLGLTLCDRASQKTVHVLPACASITDALVARLDDADAIFFDGTLWRDDELIAAGLGAKTGALMGHVAISGPDGVIARLAHLRAARKVFFHINNSNPVWRHGSEERRFIERAGWEVAYDGMEIVL